MRSSTKKERAVTSLEIMNEYVGVPKTLGSWLTLLNDKLTAKHSLRSTKELAHMFRYINKVMHVQLERDKELRCMEGQKFCNTYYTLNAAAIISMAQPHKAPERRLEELQVV